MKEAIKSYKLTSCHGCPFTYKTMENETCDHLGKKGKGAIRYNTVFLDGCPLPEVNENEETTIINGIVCTTHKWFVKGCPHGYSINQSLKMQPCSIEFNPWCRDLCGDVKC